MGRPLPGVRRPAAWPPEVRPNAPRTTRYGAGVREWAYHYWVEADGNAAAARRLMLTDAEPETPAPTDRTLRLWARRCHWMARWTRRMPDDDANLTATEREGMRLAIVLGCFDHGDIAAALRWSTAHTPRQRKRQTR